MFNFLYSGQRYKKILRNGLMKHLKMHKEALMCILKLKQIDLQE